MLRRAVASVAVFAVVASARAQDYPQPPEPPHQLVVVDGCNDPRVPALDVWRGPAAGAPWASGLRFGERSASVGVDARATLTVRPHGAAQPTLAIDDAIQSRPGTWLVVVGCGVAAAPVLLRAASALVANVDPPPGQATYAIASTVCGPVGAVEVCDHPPPGDPRVRFLLGVAIDYVDAHVAASESVAAGRPLALEVRDPRPVSREVCGGRVEATGVVTLRDRESAAVVVAGRVGLPGSPVVLVCDLGRENATVACVVAPAH